MTQKAIARVGDTATGTCTQHGGSIGITITYSSGSPNFTDQGHAVVRVDDTGIASCGHTYKVTTGSPILSADGKAVHRVGDTGIIIGGGSFTCQTGSPVFDSA